MKLRALMGLALAVVALGGASSKEGGGRRQPAKTPAKTAATDDVFPVRKAQALDPQREARISAIIAAMTLPQKIGQMTQAEIRWVTPEDAKQYYLGSILSGGGAWPGMDKHAPVSAWVDLARAYDKAALGQDAKTPIPMIWGIDAVHGHNNVFGATLYPHNIGLGAAHDPDLVKRIGRATALAVRATGVKWAFAPTLAVAGNQRWGRTYESYSSDPALVASYAAAIISGLQGDVAGEDGVIATAKHFIGDGGTFEGVDEGDARVTAAEMAKTHAAGYYAALDAGVETVMASYNSWDDEAAGKNYGKMHANKELLTDVLKGRLGFDGFVLSDWNAIEQVPGCARDHCPQAINAGVDMVMAPMDWRAFIANTMDDVKAGRISMARIDDAVRRILRVKMRAGLFDHAFDENPHLNHADALQNRALAREAVRKSAVLLKNDGGTLPLVTGAKILVVGAAADSFVRQSGGWSLTWQGDDTANADFTTGETLLGAIKAAVGEKNVVYASDGRGVNPKKFAAVIAVVGEAPYAEYKGDIRMPATLDFSAAHQTEVDLLRRVSGKGAPVVTVLYSGRTLYANEALNLSDAFVAAFLPGSEAGGLADLLFRPKKGAGRYDFQGRLSFAWPGSPCADEDAGDGMQFPRGYGLSYAAPQPVGRLPYAPVASCPAPR